MKDREKTLLHMYLPQSKELKTDLYLLFKKRVQKKSDDAYVDEGRNPIRLILNINHPICDTQVGVIVEYGSFDFIYGSKTNQDEEIGFQAIVFSGFSKDKYLLRVFKAGKAYLEKIPDEM